MKIIDVLKDVLPERCLQRGSITYYRWIGCGGYVEVYVDAQGGEYVEWTGWAKGHEVMGQANQITQDLMQAIWDAVEIGGEVEAAA